MSLPCGSSSLAIASAKSVTSARLDMHEPSLTLVAPMTWNSIGERPTHEPAIAKESREPYQGNTGVPGTVAVTDTGSTKAVYTPPCVKSTHPPCSVGPDVRVGAGRSVGGGSIPGGTRAHVTP